MIEIYSADRLSTLRSDDLCDSLERGKIVFFPRSPVDFPPTPDLDFLRNDLPGLLHRKNISYHPEQGRVVGIRGSRELLRRAVDLFREHSRRVQDFLERSIAPLSRNW